MLMKQYFNNLYKGTKKEYFSDLTNDLENNKKRFIITVNPETIMFALKNNEMNEILLNKDNSLVADGIAVLKKAQMKKVDVKERITGIDICSYLLDELNRTKKSLYLFGSDNQVLTDLVAKINSEYKGINLLGATNGYVDNKDKVFAKIKKLKPDVCLVALGIPMQELLINKYIKDFKQGIFVGVGGSFDVLSGHKKRAPKIFIKLNLEWFYRIIKEPKRIKRFFKNNVLFMLKK